MRFSDIPRWLAGAVLLLCAPFAGLATAAANTETQTVTTIHFSPGGSVFEFIDQFTKIEETNGRVVIDGECISACTMVLGLVSNDRICTTDRGSFGFHTAHFSNDDGTTRFAEEGTKVMWHLLPKNVRAWLRDQGMDPSQPHPDLIWTDADRFVKRCS
jgi:hypothetical protein